jgi:S-adenosylmethionine:tRNA ribosyltransferase-isomerase
MLLEEFDYELPPELIAQTPLSDRQASRMLILERAAAAASCDDRRFFELPELLRGDELIVINNARVIPARLFAQRLGVHAEPAGKSAQRHFLQSKIEVLLVRRIEGDLWEALVRPGRKIRIGERLVFGAGPLQAEVVARGDFGLRQLRFSGANDVAAEIERIGHMPLPPYIRRHDDSGDRERYQTIFAKQPGAVAAPTAGLHFTPEIMATIRTRGIEVREITLNVGLGTFQPIRGETLEEHKIHEETYAIPAETAAAIAQAKRERRPVLAIGTTVVRALEDAARKSSALGAGPGDLPAGPSEADIFILPGHRFAIVDQVLTNFHLPRSTLLVLVAAFAGRERILAAYRHAITAGYRFYSYGDCMLIR